MKKAGWILIFVLVLFIGDRLAGWFLQKQISVSQFRYSRMYRGEADASILLIGNSKGLNLYLPAIEAATSRKAFSLCYNGMPVSLASVLVQDYIDKYPGVKTVIVELSMLDLSEKGLINEFNSYAGDSKRIDSLIKTTNKQAWITSKVSHIYRFNNEVFQRALFFRNRLDNDWSMDKMISDRMKQEASRTKVTFKADSIELTQLKSITDYCKKKNIDVKLVISPFYPGLNLENLESFNQKIHKATGLPVLNYTRAITQDQFFADFLHLNQTGSTEFVNLLAKEGNLQ